ncbi:hypothetical protein FEM48_Zijuj01G0083800 [Ziziphus jujuba var. spinosa]|uniref:Calcium-transporting ATPase 12, plasma membrane-type-like n=1 Tax=Ziziphus jujuba var. spinosa TaxID=714518 RepID=A0A978W061_ZIZJJ|nr:hypothetical protein FEM48_Zijuj01G0083800 [Ziziphus jujuba var. spinosa]
MSDTSEHVDLESQQKVMLSSRTRWRRFLLIIKAHRVFVSILTDPPSVISLLGPSAGGVHTLPPAYISAFSSAGTNGDVPDESSSAVPDNQVSIEVVHLDVEVEDDDDYCSRARDNANLQRANIVKMVKEKDIDSLQSFGGVGGIAEALCTDLELGSHIPGDNEESTSTSLELPYARESGEAAQLSTTQATEAPRRGLFRLLKKHCSNCNTLLLSLCAALSIGFGIKEEGWKTGWYEGAIIMVAIFILILAPSIRDFIRQRRSQRLSEMHKPIDETGFVIRGGCRKELSISNIVVGDVVCLTSGSPVPGDGIFFVNPGDDHARLVVDHDGLESVDENTPFLFYGAKVIYGKGRMLITSVGMDTVLGALMNQVSSTCNETPLPVQLEKFGTTTQTAAISISILILVVLFLRFMLEGKHTTNKHSAGLPELKNAAATKGIIDIIKKIVTKPYGKTCPFTTSLAIFMVGIQEPIPFVIILAMAYMRKKMFSGKTYAKDLLAYVKVGSANIICAEKLYHPEVVRCYVGEENIQKGCWADSGVATCVGTFISLITTVSSAAIPITGIQLILANFIVNLLGGFALLSEPPTDELMNNPPISPTEPFITKRMWRNIATQALYQTSILVTFHFKGKNLLGISEQAQWVLCLIMGFVSVPIDTAVKLTTSFIKFHTLFPRTGSTSFSPSAPAYSESSVSSILELSQQGNTPNQP